MAKPPMIYLSPNEAKAIQLGLAQMMDNLISTSQNPNIPWNPEARGTLKEIHDAAQSAARKIEKYTGIEATLPPFIDGDENEFLTKES